MPPPRIRRAVRRPVQQSLDLAVAGNYLNNIDPDEMVRHLLVGDKHEYAAGVMLEKAVDHALAVQEAKHTEALDEADGDWSRRMESIQHGLEHALTELQFGRTNQDQFNDYVRRVAAAISVMAGGTLSLADAIEPEAPTTV
jgi:hypothetical protein